MESCYFSDRRAVFTSLEMLLFGTFFDDLIALTISVLSWVASLVGSDLHASTVATMMSFLGMPCGVIAKFKPFDRTLVWSWLSLYLKRLATHRFICVPLRSGSKGLFSPTLRLSLQTYLAVCILLVYAHSHELLLGARFIVVGRRLGIAPLNAAAASCLVDDLFSGLLAESILRRRRFFLAFSTKCFLLCRI